MTAADPVPHADGLKAALYRREHGAVARAITIMERGGEPAAALLESLQGRTGTARRIGITGPPGAGKSTLIGRLASLLADQGHSVGVLAVDPSSPFSRGAVLGDRVRMAAADGAERIFIRSMASRGGSGGLGRNTADAADVLDAAGFEYVLIETVGVGQAELDIRDLADTTVVVLVPESGDLVQAIKAGLMEIADIYVLNKSDRQGSGAVIAAIRSSMQHRRTGGDQWMPDIVPAIAESGAGIAELAAESYRHRRFLEQRDLLAERRARRVRARLRQWVEARVRETLWTDEGRAALADCAGAIAAGRLDYRAAAGQILDRLKDRFDG